MKKKNVRFVPMVKFVTATFWLGKPFCPLPFLSDCWVTISVVMEWNGMETDMAHGLVTMVSTGRSDRVVRWWPMTMMYPPTSSPPTHSYVRPCLHTSSTACYTGLRPRGGGGGWRCVWRSVDATALGCGPSTSTDGITTTTTRPSTQLRGGPSTTIQPINNVWTTTTTSLGPLNRQRHGGEIVLCRCFTCSSIMKTNTRGPIVDQCEPGHQTVHSTPLIGSSLGMRRWYRFRRPICRAHDRPPSRTTKTATLFTNPATSWQIDVREYVNTLIVVDLSKPQIDWSIDRSDRLPTVSAHSLSLPLFTSTRISSFLAFNFSSRLFDIYICFFVFFILLWNFCASSKNLQFLFKIILYLFFFIREIVNFVHLKKFVRQLYFMCFNSKIIIVSFIELMFDDRNWK